MEVADTVILVAEMSTLALIGAACTHIVDMAQQVAHERRQTRLRARVECAERYRRRQLRQLQQ